MERKNYRAMLEAVGGWENEMVSVPAGGVREIVEEVEALRKEVDALRKENRSVIEMCDEGQHTFVKLPDHPTRNGHARCPHCMAIGLDKLRHQLEPERPVTMKPGHVGGPNSVLADCPTIGDLKAALAEFPDDELVYFQVAAEDHTAWNMAWPTIGYAFQRTSGKVFFALRHPSLKTMPQGGWEEES